MEFKLKTMNKCKGQKAKISDEQEKNTHFNPMEI